MSIGTMLFNPFTGRPRDPRDIASDPKGILVWDGEEPLRAAESKEKRNARVQSRYEELMQEGKHGHYETLFRIVREEIERTR